MAITKLNSLAIPAGTVEPADISYPLTNFSSTGIDDNADATAITIDSSERVGIGTTGPNQLLTFGSDSGSATIGLDFETTNAVRGSILYNAGAGEMAFTSGYSGYGGYMTFDCNGAERMRIDSSGHVLIAKTALDNSTVGCRFNSTGDASFVANGNRPLVLVRKSNSGDHLIFIKDSTTVGAIGDEGGDSLYIQSGDAGLRFSDGANAIFPCKEDGVIRDNAVDLGMSSARFDTVYAGTGSINTSDEREKQDIEELTEAETRVAVACKGLLRKWRWKDAVAAKDNNSDSDEVARIHFGIIAQNLKAAFEAEGLDAGRYGMFIHTTWTDEKTGEKRDRMGIRYSELLAFIIAAI